MMEPPSATASAMQGAPGRWQTGVAGAVSIVVGLLVLIGWWAGIPAFQTVLPGVIPMRPNAAFCFVLAGVALLLLLDGRRGARITARGLVAVFGTVAALTVAEHFLGWNLGIDLLLVRDPGRFSNDPNAGLMAFNTAVCFVLTALALTLMEWPPGIRQRPLLLAVLGSGVFATALIVFSGYLANLLVGHHWWNRTGMALHASLVFLILGLLILNAAWRQAGMRWFIGRRLALCFALGMGVLAAVATDSYWSAQEIFEATDQLKLTHQVMGRIRGFWYAMGEADLAIREHAVTGSGQSMETWRSADRSSGRFLAELRELTGGNPLHRARLVQLEKQLADFSTLGETVTKVRRDQGAAAAREMLAVGTGRDLLRQMHGMLAGMEMEEYRLQTGHEARSEAIIRKALSVLSVGALVSLSFLTVGLFLLNREVTRRQDAAEALAESENRFRSLVTATSQIVWTGSPDGKVAAPLPAAVQKAARDPLEWFAPGTSSRIHPDDVENVRRAWRRALEDGTFFFSEYRVQVSPGAYRDFAVRAVPVFGPAGRLNEWVGACTDITESKQAERDIRRLNVELEQILTSAGDGIVRLDARGRVQYMNPAAEAMLGWRAAELIEQDLFERIHAWKINGGPNPREHSPIEAALRDGRPRRGVEESVWRKNGTPLPVDFTIAPILERSAVQGAVLVLRDVTGRKEAEEALRASEQRFRELADAMPQMVWSTGPDGGMAYCNSRWVEYTGLTLGQSRGMGWAQAVHPEDFARSIEGWNEAMRAGVRYNAELRYRRAAGGVYRWHLVRAEPVRDESGAIVRWLGTSTDVEHQKRAEAKILQLNETLEQRVAERTSQMETAMKELESFSYSVSHDLRAPLRAIDGYSRMLVEDCGKTLDAEGNRLLEVVRSETRRMGQLIDDLLAFSRLGRQPMQLSRVEMQSLAQGVLQQLLALEPPERHFEIVQGELPPVQGEPSMLRQVWVNLIANAIKFTRHQEPARIELGSRTENGERIFFIRDNGAGFDMRYAGKLFGVFQRLHSEAQFEGTGVGLALIQRIIHRHGGRVWAEGKPQEGATFHFTLPLNQV